MDLAAYKGQPSVLVGFLGTSNKTAGVQFNVSTLGCQNILLAWEQRHSDTASKYTRLQYTTDGSSFVDGNLITMTSTNNGWVFYVSDLSARAATAAGTQMQARTHRTESTRRMSSVSTEGATVLKQNPRTG